MAVLNQAMSLDGTRPDLADKTLLVNFWATWCAPCRREMPDLQRLSDALDRSRFAVIGVSVDADTNLAREFLLRHQIRFANLQDVNQEISSRLLGIKAFPETFIVAPDGVIIKRITGEQIWNEQVFTKLLYQSEQAVMDPGATSIYG